MDDKKFLELQRQFKELYYALRQEMRQKWKRDLPLEELLFDRWERAKSLGFGEGASIYHKIRVAEAAAFMRAEEATLNFF